MKILWNRNVQFGGKKKKKKTNENLSNLLARKQQADRGKGNPFKQKSNWSQWCLRFSVFVEIEVHSIYN